MQKGYNKELPAKVLPTLLCDKTEAPIFGNFEYQASVTHLQSHKMIKGLII